MSEGNGREALSFDVVEEEHPFKFRGVDYVLREPLEAANLKHDRKRYQNAKVKDGKVQADIHDAMEAPSVLLGECVFEAGKRDPIGQKAVAGWPHRLVKLLYDKAREMSQADTAESIDAQIEVLQKAKERAADPKKPQPSTETD